MAAVVNSPDCVAIEMAEPVGTLKKWHGTNSFPVSLAAIGEHISHPNCGQGQNENTQQ